LLFLAIPGSCVLTCDLRLQHSKPSQVRAYSAILGYRKQFAAGLKKVLYPSRFAVQAWARGGWAR